MRWTGLSSLGCRRLSSGANGGVLWGASRLKFHSPRRIFGRFPPIWRFARHGRLPFSASLKGRIEPLPVPPLCPPLCNCRKRKGGKSRPGVRHSAHAPPFGNDWQCIQLCPNTCCSLTGHIGSARWPVHAIPPHGHGHGSGSARVPAFSSAVHHPRSTIRHPSVPTASPSLGSHHTRAHT